MSRRATVPRRVCAVLFLAFLSSACASTSAPAEAENPSDAEEGDASTASESAEPEELSASTEAWPEDLAVAFVEGCVIGVHSSAAGKDRSFEFDAVRSTCTCTRDAGKLLGVPPDGEPTPEFQAAQRECAQTHLPGHVSEGLRQWPESERENFMKGCLEGGTGEALCGCVLSLFEVSYDSADLPQDHQLEAASIVAVQLCSQG